MTAHAYMNPQLRRPSYARRIPNPFHHLTLTRNIYTMQIHLFRSFECMCFRIPADGQQVQKPPDECGNSQNIVIQADQSRLTEQKIEILQSLR